MRLNTSSAIESFLRYSLLEMGKTRVESAIVLFLTSTYELSAMKLYEGGHDHVDISILDSEVTAARTKASFVVVAHTHHGSDPRPSLIDIEMFRSFTDAFRMKMDTKVLDFFILTPSNSFSAKRDFKGSDFTRG